MSTEEKLQTRLPDWLVSAIEAGEPLEGVPARRGESRLHAWSFSCRIVPVGGDPSASFTSNLQNVSLQGLGFISRQSLTIGNELDITPTDQPGAPCVRARILHCTVTLQGFNVGVFFIGSKH